MKIFDLYWFGEIAEESRFQAFAMSRGMALALRATTGMCCRERVFTQDFQGFDATDCQAG